jgi:hypothetical protein
MMGNQKQLSMKMEEVNELLNEKDSYEAKGIDKLSDTELDSYYKVSDRIRELIGADIDVQRKIEYSLGRRFGRRL